MNLPPSFRVLGELLCCHSTPGEEDEVAAVLLREWGVSGWQGRSHGRFAVSAVRGTPEESVPTVLVCGHMDSPGFTVSAFGDDRTDLMRLGGASFAGESAAGVLRTCSDHVSVTICRERDEDQDETSFFVPAALSCAAGDRVCFHADPACDSEGILVSPFLDNRLGCWALVELARQLPRELPVNVVLGATCCEEFGGFGAPVLARAVQPDAVICLDATYEAAEQDVVIGGGPVLTLSDASVMVGGSVRDRMLRFFEHVGVPLQTEVYNTSGTDCRAFPHQGLDAVVYALLLPTAGNHTPEERAALADLEKWLRALRAMLEKGQGHGLFAAGFGEQA